MYQVINPATGVLIEEFPTATDAEVKSAIARSDAAYRLWRERPVEVRALAVNRAGELFRERADELAGVVTQEMGKRIEEAKGELRLVCSIFSYYSKNGPALLDDELLEIKRGQAVIQKRPIGPLLGVMPWNYPYYQVARFAAPNLLLGNTILLKHAPNCPRSAALIEQIFHDAGVPEDAYTNLYATNDQVAWMLADDRIQGVSLTGSERAGAAVAAAAGQNLKKFVLELGGSDPLIVLDTSDMDGTVNAAVRARMNNNGQACNGPKRMIIMDDIYEEFVAKLADYLSTLIPGDPADPQTTLAPMSSQAAADRLIEQIEDAVEKGASLLLGGSHVKGPGAFVEPTVLTGVKPGMRAYSEELFGPAVVIYRVENEDEAITLANDSAYGLGASIFTDDPVRAQRVGDRLESGMLTINSAGGSQADLPFGGVKRSGVGRELGALGIEEFMNKRIVRTSS